MPQEPTSDPHVPAELLIAHAEDRVPAPDRERVRRHVVSCEACRLHVEDLRSFDARLGGSPNPAEALQEEGPDEELRAALRARSESLLLRRTRRGFRGIVLLAAAAVVLLALMLWRPGGGEPEALTVVAVVERSAEALRAGESGRIHFTVTPAQDSYLAVIEVAPDAAIEMVLGPTEFAALGRPGPFRAGEPVRVPPDPLFDLEARSADSWFVIAATPEALSSVRIGELREELRTVPRNAADLAAALAERLRSSGARASTVGPDEFAHAP